MRTSQITVAFLILVSTPLWGLELILRSKEAGAVSTDPLDKAWRKAEAIQVPIVPQTFRVPHGGGSVKSVEVKSLYTQDHIFFRLSWPDGSKDTRATPGSQFSDACALQFPVKENSFPSPFMGEEGEPVNIWHWRAAAAHPNRYDPAYADFHRTGAIETHIQYPELPAQSLFAEGFGTLTPGAEQDMEASALWKGGRWTVVFKRRLTSTEGAGFKEGESSPIAFAVWDGGDQNRGGAKSLSFWHTLVLGGAAPVLPETDVERGKRAFLRHGCVTCHGPGGQGGVKNPNAQGGEVPPIHKVRDGFTEEELEQVIRFGRPSVPDDPRGPAPPLRMNAWGEIMDEKEIHDLVKYLWSLAPKSEEW